MGVSQTFDNSAAGLFPINYLRSLNRVGGHLKRGMVFRVFGETIEEIATAL